MPFRPTSDYTDPHIIRFGEIYRKVKHILRTASDVTACLRAIEDGPMDPPREVEIRLHKADRSAAQNSLAFLWYKAAADQMDDDTANGKRALCKLTVGIPIRREDDEFREVYDETIRPLSYGQKLSIMVEPIDFPVTRDMSVKDMGRYLEGVDMLFSGQGVVLPRPDELYQLAIKGKR